MSLVHRGNVETQATLVINKDKSRCLPSDCDCFEKYKRGLQFAILSHRWDEDELSFQDLSDIMKHRGNNTSGDYSSSSRGESYSTLLDVLNENKYEGGGELLKKMQIASKGMPPRSGFTKLVKLCEVAIKRQCKYVWMDTICINKESSAELEESIRSMFAWYRDSHVCAVHLGSSETAYKMRDDPWFTRGWTL